MSDLWKKMRLTTQARIGLTRHGHAIGTKDLLDFQMAHAGARDAVLNLWDANATLTELKEIKEQSIVVATEVTNRIDHLQRPDLGRALNEASKKELKNHSGKFEIVIAVTDGLSAKAIEAHFIPFWKFAGPLLRAQGYIISPIILAPFGRVALSDEIGEALKAKLVLMFVGERPGLSSTDSMGLYMTYDPKKGNSDAGRNCVSNIRPPEGLDYETATAKLMFLVTESFRRELSGVTLKEAAETTLTSNPKPAIETKNKI